MLFWPHTPFCTLVLQRSFYVTDGRLRSTTYNRGSSVCMNGRYFVAWENRKHLATPPVVSSRNDAWKTSAEIPYPWRATAHIWVVLLIGRSIFPTNQKQWPDLSIGKSSVGNFSACVSGVTSQGNQWWLFSQARQVNKWSLFCFLYQPSLLSVFFSVFCFGDSPHYLKKKLHRIWEIKGFFEIKRTREKTPRTKN